MGSFIDDGLNLSNNKCIKKNIQRVFGALVGYFKGYSASAELMFLSKDEIDVEKVEIAFVGDLNTVPDEREPKLNISLIGCLAK